MTDYNEGNVFVLSWDMYGLESIISVTEREHEYTLDTLRTGRLEHRNKIMHEIQAIILRATVNSHRHYEVYSIAVDKGISTSSLAQLFTDNPQGAAELIRDRGTKLYSDRASAKEKIVIR